MFPFLCAPRSRAATTLPDAAVPIFAFLAVPQHDLAIARSRSFSDDDNRRRIAAIRACLDGRSDLVVIERNFRDQNYVRAACDPAMQRDPAGMTPHHLEDHDAFVAGGRGVQPVERIHHGRDRGIETESHRRRFQIVVDGFWNADAIDASLLKL